MKNILIVDDEFSIRKLLNIYLEDAGYCCWKAQDVQQARAILHTQAIDLILSDINMPGESGIDLIRFVKQNCIDVPVVIVSVIDNPNDAKEALELDVYGYIVKPFTRNLVLIGVDNALRRHRLELQSKAYQNELEIMIRLQTAKMQNQVVFLQNLMDAIPFAVFYISREGIFMECNRVFEQFVGLPRAAIIGKRVDEVFPENLAGIGNREDWHLLSTEHQEFELTMTNAKGKRCDMLIKKAISIKEDICMEGTVAVMLDITERKKMDLALRTSEEKFQQITDNIDIGVAIIGPQMEITRMNPKMRWWFPHVKPGKGCRCHHAFQVPPKEEPCENCPVVRTFAEGKSFESTVRMEGERQNRYFRDHSSPIHDEKGNIIAAILLVEDVTEKLVLERELRQTQKLEAIGQLAAGIAHEINTPIQYVGDNTSFLRDAFEDLTTVCSAYENLLQAVKTNTVTDAIIEGVDKYILETDVPYLKEEIPSAIEQSMEGVQRVTEIIRAMRDFSHPGGDQKTMVDLNYAINNTVTVARNEWKYVAEMVLDLDYSIPEVFCLPGEINQVLLNIIVNAAQAIADVFEQTKQGKGKITIATLKENDSIVIHISDTGAGIPKRVQHRIFDPFFTTKGVGEGTGQGLAIAHRVITDKHGGSLRFETEQGKGTTFVIELPLAPTREEDK